MASRPDLLRQVMTQTGTSQSELARISGVRQPSISQVLSGRIDISDGQLRRLLACMGYQLEVVRSAAPAELTRSERRSWLLHRRLASAMDDATLNAWSSMARQNLARLRRGVQGEPHERNLRRWASLFSDHDITGLRRVMTGLDRDAIEMREVSPLGGLLSEDERQAVLAEAGR